MFISFEGGEGSGKSTQSKLLVDFLESKSLPVVYTREPGGTVLAESIRNLVLDVKHVGLPAKTEALLFAAARSDIVSKVIKPALLNGSIVVCDRFIDSSIAYQGFGRDLGWVFVKDLNIWASDETLPDLTFFMNVDPVVGLSRVSNPDRLESEPVSYHERVNSGFLFLASIYPERFVVVDGSQSVDVIARLIVDKVSSFLDSK